MVTDLGIFSPNVALQGETNLPGSPTFISNLLLYKEEKGISLIDNLLFASNTVEKHLDDFEQILSNIAYVSEAKKDLQAEELTKLIYSMEKLNTAETSYETDK